MSRSRLVSTELDGPRDVARWRRIRRRIVATRQRTRSAPRVPASALAIDVVAYGPHVHYPASIDDVRGVLERLPEGTLDGLGRIAFRLTPRGEVDGPVDPHVGRLSASLLPGVYAPSTRGTYRPSDASIELFGYVYAPDVPERGLLDTYLRAMMIATLLHEVGHHRDYVRRGRWREAAWENEWRADALAAGWMRTCALPYLEDTYPHELAELQRWFLRTTGIAHSIDVLLGARDGVRYFMGATEGFERLLARPMRGEPIDTAAIVDFAFHLHVDDFLDEALAVVDHVLASEPGHAEALRWRAHVLEHLAATPTGAS